MKKRLLILTTVFVAAMGAFADTVNTTMNQFYFESKDEAGVRLKSSYEWDVSVGPPAPGGKFTKTSGTTTFQAILGQPFTTVGDWGLSDTTNIADADWRGVASTNFTYTHTGGFGTKYLYLFVRYFRYNLTLNAGAGDPSSYVTNNICYTNSIALPEPSRTGYDFVGWTNGTLTVALTGEQTGAELQVQEDDETVMLYAKWEPKTFTVTFDPNGDGASVSPTSKPVAYDSIYGDLPTPTRTSYAFAGWFTDATEGVQIQSNAVVSITSNQTLYAHWSQLYTVTFQNSDGSVIYKRYTDVLSGSRVEPPDISEVTVPEGWIFTGDWSSSGYENVTRNLIILPKFYAIETSLNFSCSPTEGGSIHPENHGSGLYEYGRTVTLTVTPNDAYDFAGWSDGSMDNPYNVRVIISTNLVARFTLKKLTVDFLDWDGTTTNDTQIVEYGSGAEAPMPLAHPGYTFTSWNADFSNVISNMTVVAQYEANRYTVVYNANGGVGEMTNEVFTYGQVYQLQSNAYTRAVNEFVGWASDATTNEVEYSDGAFVSNLTTVANGTNTLYAVWNSQLSDLSVAADCDNLILKSDDKAKQWVVDDTEGYNGQGSSVKSGEAFTSLMKAKIEGPGTLSFGVKTIILDGGWFGLYPGDDDYNPHFVIQSVNTGGVWKRYVYEIKGSGDSTYTWLFYSYGTGGEKDQCWVDQVHWYPNQFVTVENNKLTDDEKNAITEAILQNWDTILGENAASISSVVATGAAVTNAVALLNDGYRPELDLTASPPTLTFENQQTVRISDFVVTNLPTAILEATILPHDTQPEVNLWGAPTLTSGWSQIESEGDFSKFAAEGIVTFEFDVSTNRFFKVIAK